MFQKGAMTGTEQYLLATLPLVLYRADAGSFAGPRRLGAALAARLGPAPEAFEADPGLWPSCIHADDLPRVLAHFATPGAERFSIEYRVLDRAGGTRDFLDQGERAAGAGPPMVAGFCLDVTERRRLEQSLIDARRPAATGILVEALIHDVMNALSVAITNLDGLTRRIESISLDPRVHRRIETALDGAVRTADLLRMLTAFAGRRAGRQRAVDVGMLLERLAVPIHHLLGAERRLTLVLDPELWPVPIDEAALESLIAALISDIRAVMAPDAVLTITGWNDEASGRIVLGFAGATRHAPALSADAVIRRLGGEISAAPGEFRFSLPRAE